MITIHQFSRRKKALNTRGDTIIEVMIVMAILGLAFMLASVTANRGLAQSRNAEEHSQAQGILTSQIELVRKAVANKTSLFAGDFCMKDAANPTTTLDDCKVNDRYQPKVTKLDGGNGDVYYQFKVNWLGQGGLGPQQEVMNYRVHDLVPSTPTYMLSASKPQIQVEVKRLNPIADGAGGHTSGPGLCSNPSAGISNKDGTPVTLQRITPAGASVGPIPTVTSTVLFNDLTAGYVYRASISPPAGYNACSTSSANVTAVDGAATLVNTMKIYPQCHTEVHKKSLGVYRDPLGVYGDPLGVYPDYGPSKYWDHEGGPEERRHAGWPPYTFQQMEGSQLVEYRIRTDLGPRGPSGEGYFYERWVQKDDWAHPVPITPPYMHTTPPYMHWSEPTEHFDYVPVGVCTDFPADF